jgi:uncharacterized small protein (DUF1192 family)
MASFDEDAVFGAKRPATPTHQIGEVVDALSAPELAERIEALKREIARLEAEIRAREMTRAAASAFFKT